MLNQVRHLVLHCHNLNRELFAIILGDGLWVLDFVTGYELLVVRCNAIGESAVLTRARLLDLSVGQRLLAIA